MIWIVVFCGYQDKNQIVHMSASVFAERDITNSFAMKKSPHCKALCVWKSRDLATETKKRKKWKWGSRSRISENKWINENNCNSKLTVLESKHKQDLTGWPRGFSFFSLYFKSNLRKRRKVEEQNVAKVISEIWSRSSQTVLFGKRTN